MASSSVRALLAAVAICCISRSRRDEAEAATSARRTSVTSWLVPSIRTGRPPAGSRVTRQRACTHRTSPSGRSTRVSNSKECRSRSASSVTSRTCSRSSGCRHATKASNVPSNSSGGTP